MINPKRKKELKTLAKTTMGKFNNPFDINDFQDIIRSGQIKDIKEVEIFIRECKCRIHDYKVEMEDYFHNKCDKHNYADWTYTFQKRIIDYVYVYEQKCKKCGHTVNKQVDDKKECPVGSENAQEQYYNNFL